MSEPKVIFLDAVGTLFGVKGSVGEIYSAIAKQAGVVVAPESLNKAFIQTFKATQPLAFPSMDKEKIPDLEFEWWKAIAQTTFAKAGVLDKFSNFNSFFTQLYAYFATDTPWLVYPDVVPMLNYWREKGIELGIISNFDTRIYTVMEVLDLHDFFISITISSTTGAAKPNSQIFTTALEKHNCQPEFAWHIGDSLKEDYYGALGAGIKPFLIERE